MFEPENDVLETKEKIMRQVLAHLDNNEITQAKKLLLETPALQKDTIAILCLLFIVRKYDPSNKSEEENYSNQSPLWSDAKKHTEGKADAALFFTWINDQAHKDCPQAQNCLAIFYQYGLGVPQDYKTAVKWRTKAAERGVLNAQHNLGLMYYRNTPPNYKEALKWLTRAAKQGFAKAQYNLGIFYYFEEASCQNYTKALEWFTLAALQDCIDAQGYLGRMYLNGEGIPQNNDEALKWFTRAAQQGDEDAELNLGYMYEHGRGVPRNNDQALIWYTKAALKGNAISQLYLANFYFQHIQNIAKALQWYYRSAMQNEQRAITKFKEIILPLPQGQTVSTFQGIIEKYSLTLRKLAHEMGLLRDNSKIHYLTSNQEFQQTVERISFDFGLLLGFHRHAGKMIDTVFFIPEYTEMYELIYSRVERYFAIIRLFEESSIILTNSFELSPHYMDTPSFPSSKVNYPPSEKGSFSIRYYKRFGAWAFDEESVAVTDLACELLDEADEERALLEKSTSQVQVLHRFQYYLSKKHQISFVLSEESAWPQNEIVVKDEYMNAISNFKRAMEEIKRLPQKPISIKDHASMSNAKESALKYGMKAQFLDSLIKANIIKTNGKDIVAYWEKFFLENLNKESENFSTYETLPVLLTQFMENAIVEGNATLQKLR